MCNVQAHGLVAGHRWLLHLGLDLRHQPDPGPEISHRQEEVTGSQVSCKAFLLLNCPFFLLSYCLTHTVLLSYCPIVLLSYCPIVLLSYCPTVLLSYCPTDVL